MLAIKLISLDFIYLEILPVCVNIIHTNCFMICVLVTIVLYITNDENAKEVESRTFLHKQISLLFQLWYLQNGLSICGLEDIKFDVYMTSMLFGFYWLVVDFNCYIKY